METMLVKRDGHPDGVVLINAADFDPATETKWEPDAPPAEPDVPPISKGKRAAP